MRRAFTWLGTLLNAALIGVCMWPAEHSLLLFAVVAAAVLVSLSCDSTILEASATTLGVVAATVLAEPALAISRGSFDVRIAWAAILAAVLFRSNPRIRVHSLVTAAVIAVTIIPPSDTSLLIVSPPVLLQVVVCLVAISLQAFDHRTRRWWPAYRIAEPLLVVALASAFVLPFAHNGLTLSELVAWHVYVGVAASLIAFVDELLMRFGPRQQSRAGE
ncbi:MAG: hypothetical protein JO197_16945 [Acidobacteria bacterium]|nr:hypothetical protein [Acidobacteriota bacterium]MBV9478489.1 hypothetical protein [Acidobacteriota bacterium]